MRGPTRRRSAPARCSTISPSCRGRSNGSGLLHELEIDTAAMQLGEIAGHQSDFGLQFHAHRHQQIAGYQPAVPDRALSGALALLGIGREAGDLFAFHMAGAGRTGETLTAGRRQDLLSTIGVAKVVAAAAFVNRDDERTVVAAGESAL